MLSELTEALTVLGKNLSLPFRDSEARAVMPVSVCGLSDFRPGVLVRSDGW